MLRDSRPLVGDVLHARLFIDRPRMAAYTPAASMDGVDA